jgi:retron-type reverse transcriptase
LHSYKQIKNKEGFFIEKGFLEKKLNVLNFKQIEKIAIKIRQGIYVFGFGEKKSILKLSSKQNRKLISINFWDKIVQKAIQIVLNKIYENLLKKFHISSHGFRPGKSCHTALKEIKFT